MGLTPSLTGSGSLPLWRMTSGRVLAEVLGLTLKAPESKVQEAMPFIDLLVALRGELRAAKQFALADRVRDGLTDLGIELRDGPDGTTWTA